MARRKANRMSIADLARESYKKNARDFMAKYDVNYRTGAEIYKNVFRDFIQELEIQFKNGHHIALGTIGYIYAGWHKPYECKNGRKVKGYYHARMRFARRLKMYLKGLEEGDFDLEYIDEYPDGIVTENGILRKRREDAEFFND